jgi:hypothetical protein
MKAFQQLRQSKNVPVTAQLSAMVSKNQEDARKCLNIIFTSLRLLLRQGLALRGHDIASGNFFQLLKLRSNDLPEMSAWLERKTNFIHSDIQNEIASMFSHSMLRQLCRSISLSSCFAVIVDGTQDIAGEEQESICIRYVDEDLEPQECFMSLYKTDSTTGESLAGIVQDVLMRFQLPIENLRGQTYDGAANMSGKYNGCRAIISAKQPLALFVHCGAHGANLVAKATCEDSPEIRNAIQVVHDFATLCTTSGKFRQKFSTFQTNAGPVHAIRPLCPTRWLMRAPMLQSAKSQYVVIVQSLQEASEVNESTAARASQLLKSFEDGETYVCITFALNVVEKLECFNRALQSRSASVAGMLEACDMIIASLEVARTEESFTQVFQQCINYISENELNPLQLPRRRNPPKRFSGPCEPHHSPTIHDHYRAIYFHLIDTAIMQLRIRFQTNPDLHKYKLLEAVVLNRASVENIQQHADFKNDLLEAQLKIFHANHVADNVSAVANILKKLSPDARRLFDQIEKLVRLLLVNPASSAEAERSFSALRRLKTWLRSTMGQTRLNSTAICHIHKSLLDQVDLSLLMTEFISKSEIRKNIFG